MRFITYQLTQCCWACIDKLCKLSLVQACIYTLLFDEAGEALGLTAEEADILRQTLGAAG